MKWNRYFSFCFVILFIILLNISCNLWNDLWGNHDLGNNLSLWDGDSYKDKVIVYCTTQNGGACVSGIFVVPNTARHMINGKYAEYVEEFAFNKKWVIVKTHEVKDKQENYYIISKEFDISNLDCVKSNCDSILQNYVIGPMNLSEFEDKKHILNIDLGF